MLASVLSNVIDWLLGYKYLAMFGILFFCGVGLPIPEEVTLVGSGLLVGWQEANYFWASAACVLGILAGDSVIFGLGHHYGRRFLLSRPMRFILPPRRQAKVGRFFSRHGMKAVFFARFIAGVRIGVYAYAGSQRMPWRKFLLLDFLGAMISGPTSVFLGAWVARVFASNRDEAATRALDLARRLGHWLVLGAVLFIVAMAGLHFLRRRLARRAPVSGDAPPRPSDGASVPVKKLPPVLGSDGPPRPSDGASVPVKKVQVLEPKPCGRGASRSLCPLFVGPLPARPSSPSSCPSCSSARSRLAPPRAPAGWPWKRLRGRACASGESSAGGSSATSTTGSCPRRRRIRGCSRCCASGIAALRPPWSRGRGSSPAST